MFLKNKKYKSEVSEFISNLKSKNPKLEKTQNLGRSILWDRTDVSGKETFEKSSDQLKQSSYVYF